MKTRGFSLVEMLVVVALLGLILAVAMPNLMETLHSVSLNTAITNFNSSLLKARQTAISRNGTTYIEMMKSQATPTSPILLTQINAYRETDGASGLNTATDEKTSMVSLPSEIYIATFAGKTGGTDLPVLNGNYVIGFSPSGETIDPTNLTAKGVSAYIQVTNRYYNDRTSGIRRYSVLNILASGSVQQEDHHDRY